ncbi:MAG: 5-formyltetrahydrofolate cyclo-ligase, partial [Alphaproteobacteria bacterium]
PAKSDGRRILVDRVWPRGITKDDLRIDAWRKDLAPSTDLRKWFGHDPLKWEEFKSRYARELEARPEGLEELAAEARAGHLTLVFGARDTEHNNAVALKEYLESRVPIPRRYFGDAAGAWAEVRAWRRSKRAELLAHRRAMPRDVKRAAQRTIIDVLRTSVPELAGCDIGLYWPIKGEIDVRSAVSKAASAALPVVVAERQPLEFWAWAPGTQMARGIWNIPIPAERKVVHPAVLLVPLLGYDSAGYRLGYGGGYYDRTLAAMDPRPLTIGIGFEAAALKTIHPQPHDIPMDLIVTETEIKWFRLRRSSAVSNCVRDRQIPQFH